ncbi:hypothetical protein F9B74_03105 [Pelistega sp. NLN82]|uniref:Carrier domain-containing protein n=1 Tax=Pelistega ratti TaxID=2652177 RepID=A0A6L9Y4Y9_9BURK|nr:phosphopantetheine-binding protein [Pelistega ratti]NEN75316.1 hypothetical protein [Pelistega ratti]
MNNNRDNTSYKVEITKISRSWLEQRVKSLLSEDIDIDEHEKLMLYGIDSLHIMKLSSELQQYEISVSFSELGKNPTLSAWWEIIQNKKRVNK